MGGFNLSIISIIWTHTKIFLFEKSFCIVRVDGCFCSLKTSHIDLHWPDKNSRLLVLEMRASCNFSKGRFTWFISTSDILYMNILNVFKRFIFMYCLKEKRTYFAEWNYMVFLWHPHRDGRSNEWLACGAVADTFSKMNLYHHNFV